MIIVRIIGLLQQHSPSMVLARPHDLTCQVCEKRCSNDQRFFRHMHKYHPDFWRVFSGGVPLSEFLVSPGNQMKDKPFFCSICNKRYIHKTGYAKHMSSHSSGNHQAGHQGVHNRASTDGGNVFECSVCKKMFTKEAYLLRHMEMKVDGNHCAALDELKKNSSMFKATFIDGVGAQGLAALDPRSQVQSRFHGNQHSLMRCMSEDYERRYLPEQETTNLLKYNNGLPCFPPPRESPSNSPISRSASGYVPSFGSGVSDSLYNSFTSFANNINQDRYFPRAPLNSRSSYYPNSFFSPTHATAAVDEMCPSSYFSSSYIQQMGLRSAGIDSKCLASGISQGALIHPTMDSPSSHCEAPNAILDSYFPRCSNLADQDSSALHNLSRFSNFRWRTISRLKHSAMFRYSDGNISL